MALRDKLPESYNPNFDIVVGKKVWRFREGQLSHKESVIHGMSWEERKRVVLDVGLRKRSKLFVRDTLMHETLHILCPEWNEERVTFAATVLARVLKAAGL